MTRLHWAILGFGMLLHLVATHAWLLGGGFFTRPPYEDAAFFRLQAQIILDEGASQGVVGIVTAGLAFEHYHPPLFPICIALTAHLLGVPPEGVALWLPTALFGVLFAWGAGLIISALLPPPDRWLAAVLFLACPGFICFLRPALNQMPMVALTVVSIGQLLASRWGERLWHVAGAGSWAGLALLTKNLALVEVGAFALAFVAIWIERRPRGWKRVLVAAVAFTIPMALIASWWYATNWERVHAYARGMTDAEGQGYWSGGLTLWSLDRWTAYSRYFVRHCVGTPLGLVVPLVFGTLLVIDRVRSSRPNAVNRSGGGRFGPNGIGPRPRRPTGADTDGIACLAATAATSYVVVTVGQVHADAHFTLQWIPLFVVLSAWMVGAMRPRLRVIARVAYVAVAVIMAIAPYRPWESYGTVVVGGVTVLDDYDARRFSETARSAGCRSTPDVEKWPIADLVRAAAAWTQSRPDTVVSMICQGDEYPRYLEVANVAYQSLRDDVDVQLRYVELEGGASRGDLRIMELLLGSSGFDRRRGGLKFRAPDPTGMDGPGVDVLCVDARLAARAHVRSLVEQSGYVVEELFDVTVTPKWRFLVLGVRRRP